LSLIGLKRTSKLPINQPFTPSAELSNLQLWFCRVMTAFGDFAIRAHGAETGQKRKFTVTFQIDD